MKWVWSLGLAFLCLAALLGGFSVLGAAAGAGVVCAAVGALMSGGQ